MSMTEAVGALRLTLSTANTAAEMDQVVEVLPGVVAALRSAVGTRAG